MRATTPIRATAWTIAGMIVASLLTAPSLAAVAERQPYGNGRNLAVAVTERLVSVSRHLGLDRPHDWLGRVVYGPGPGSTRLAATSLGSHTPPSATDEETAAAPSLGVASEPAQGDTRSVSSASTADAAPRTVTPAAPLRLWVAGDSLWETPGPALTNLAASTGLVDVELDFRYSTGLTRPDFFDWIEHARAELARLDPDHVLFMVGANDWQGLATAGGVHQAGTDGYLAEYRRRVHEMMSVLSAGGRPVTWMGLPVMRSPRYDAHMQVLDGIYAAESERFSTVHHLPTRSLFADMDGAYADYLTTPSGTPRPMRKGDGIHLSEPGGNRLAAVLWKHLEERWALPG